MQRQDEEQTKQELEAEDADEETRVKDEDAPKSLLDEIEEALVCEKLQKQEIRMDKRKQQMDKGSKEEVVQNDQGEGKSRGKDQSGADQCKRSKKIRWKRNKFAVCISEVSISPETQNWLQNCRLWE